MCGFTHGFHAIRCLFCLDSKFQMNGLLLFPCKESSRQPLYSLTAADAESVDELNRFRDLQFGAS
jgi:hypothetical protein